MSQTYTNVMLTVIALLLSAVVAKLYFPTANEIGPQIAAPTREEISIARKIKDPILREKRLEHLRSRLPVLWVAGGEIDTSGSEVKVDGTVEVEGEVSIARSDY